MACLKSASVGPSAFSLPSIVSRTMPGCVFSASRIARASWTCLRVRPISAVVWIMFPFGHHPLRDPVVLVLRFRLVPALRRIRLQDGTGQLPG